METKKRSLSKAISWRIVASLITGGMVFCFTQESLLAVSVAICDSLIKILAYFIHERIWTGIRYGVVSHPLHRFPVLKPLAIDHEKLIRQQLREFGYLQD